MRITTLMTIPLQDWMNNVFGINNETSAPIIITVSIFIFSYLIKWISDSFRKLVRRENIRRITFNSINAISKSIEKQANNFTEYSSNLNVQNTDQVFGLKREEIQESEIFEKLDYVILYNSFFTGIENWFKDDKNRLKLFSKMMAIVNSFRETEIRYPKQIDEFLQRFNNYENKRNEIVENFRRHYDSIIASTDGQKVPRLIGDYLVSMDSVGVVWQQKQHRTHYYVMNEYYINPLIEISREVVNRKLDMSDPVNISLKRLAQENLNYLLGASHQYENLKTTLENYSDVFKGHEKHHTSNIIKLEKIRAEL